MSDIRFNRWLHQSGTGGVYQDSTGRVGIGTSVPTTALDVQSGSIKIGSNTLSSSGVSTFTTINANSVISNSVSSSGVSTFSSGIVVAAGSTAVPSISPSGDSNTGIFFPSPDTIAIGEGGTEVLRVNSSGRVGVGTNLMTRPFEVWAGTGGTSFSVDSSGRVRMPFQPAFWITNFSWSTSIQRPHSASIVFTNVGSHFNNTNGIFTAPVEGYYLFICTVQGHNPSETVGRSATYYNLVATKNNVDLGNEIVATANDIAGKHDHITHQVIVNLAANDIFYFRSNYGYRTFQNSYCGYLLG